MDPSLEGNVRGRVFMVCTRQGRTDIGAQSAYVDDIVREIAARYPQGRPSLAVLEPFLSEQLALLEARLGAAVASATAAGEVLVDVPAVAELDSPSVVVDDDLFASDELPLDPVASAVKRVRDPRANAGSTAAPRSMEEKLKQARKPIQKLLREDCVQLGLVEKGEVDGLLGAMPGKAAEQAADELTEMLRGRLQDQVRVYMRANSGGPWKGPLEQENIRQDIHAARNVPSVLMLMRQIVRECREWEKTNGGSRLLGLFASRKRGLL